MKYLTLLRHAKSSWKDPAWDDFDRPLNNRGKRDAPLMGDRMIMLGSVPEVIISSPARRARRTAELVAAAMHYPEADIRFEPLIYDAEAFTLVELVKRLDNAWQDVMLVGHNPGVTDLANLLTPFRIDNFATCGVAKFSFDTESWLDIMVNPGRLLFYEYPKKGN